MATQRKETGTAVDFMQGLEITNLQTYTYRDDVFGILGYQPTPITIDAATRDAFLNGNLTDVVNQTWSQGMQANYAVISWNETAQNDGSYLVTDCRVGIVVKVMRDYNTGPAYLIDCLKAVPWVNTTMTKLAMFNFNSWKSWKLLSQKRPEPYNYCADESVSQLIWVGAPLDTPLPELPDPATVKATIKSQGNFQKALGDFTFSLLDKGFTVTYPTNAYDIDICYERTANGRLPGNPNNWGYAYRVHVRFWWEFTTDPEITSVPATLSGKLFEITIGVILAIILAIGLVVWVSIGAYNLTHTHSEYQKWGYVYNPNTGQWEWKVVETGSKDAPPDWWGYVIPIVALMGIGAGVYLIVPYLRKGEGRKK